MPVVVGSDGVVEDLQRHGGDGFGQPVRPAEVAKRREEQERREKEQERQEKERLLTLLKQAGIDPNQS